MQVSSITQGRNGAAVNMDDLSRSCCLNYDCPEHGMRGAGSLTVTSRYGSRKGRRMLRCRVCKARFSERKGTPYFDSRLPPETFRSVLDHIAEGCGVRQTGRLCKVDRGAVGRLSPMAGDQEIGVDSLFVRLRKRCKKSVSILFSWAWGRNWHRLSAPQKRELTLIIRTLIIRLAPGSYRGAV
jgi:hypothetical protein